MPAPTEITRLTVENEFRTCPACGYERGFHTSFFSAGAGRGNPIRSTREVFRVILICPECGAQFDIGWRVSFAEFESRFVKAPVKTTPCEPHGSPVACLPAPLPHDQHPPE
jgi:hypothetical protein